MGGSALRTILRRRGVRVARAPGGSGRGFYLGQPDLYTPQERGPRGGGGDLPRVDQAEHLAEEAETLIIDGAGHRSSLALDRGGGARTAWGGLVSRQ